MMEKGLDPRAVAEEFGLCILGSSENKIQMPGSINKQSKNAILWIKNGDYIEKIKKGYVVISSEIAPSYCDNTDITYLVTDSKPKLIFSRILSKYFDIEDDAFENYVDEHKRNKNIKIGDNVFIGKDVVIGDNTRIHPNVTIHSRTKIGRNCVIMTQASIGTEGLGLELDHEKQELVKFPQIGGVILEDNVELGPSSTIRRSALDNTIIKKGTKIGALCNIGHNCIIGENCILTCSVVTAGSSIIGNNVFMGVSSIVRNGINVGNNAVLGQGSVVTTDITQGTTVIGSPAMEITKYKAWSNIKNMLLKKHK